MKITKKLLGISMAAVLCAVSFTACAKKETVSSTPAGNAFEAQLITAGKITIGTSADYAPYESMNTKGEIEGFDIDMMNEVVKYMSEGGNPIVVEFKNMDFDVIVTALQTGQVDLGVSAFTYDPKRDVKFSTPYLISEQVICVTTESGYKTIEDITGKNVGAGMGTTGEAAAKENIKDAKVTSPGDYNVMFEALKNGALDAVVCDGQVAKNFAAANNLLIFPDPLIDEENSVIVKNENEELLKSVNEAVAKFKESPKYSELQKKWGFVAE